MDFRETCSKGKGKYEKHLKTMQNANKDGSAFDASVIRAKNPQKSGSIRWRPEGVRVKNV
jgi:hypothetical protein